MPRRDPRFSPSPRSSGEGGPGAEGAPSDAAMHEMQFVPGQSAKPRLAPSALNPARATWSAVPAQFPLPSSETLSYRPQPQRADSHQARTT